MNEIMGKKCRNFTTARHKISCGRSCDRIRTNKDSDSDSDSYSKSILRSKSKQLLVLVTFYENVENLGFISIVLLKELLKQYTEIMGAVYMCFSFLLRTHTDRNV